MPRGSSLIFSSGVLDFFSFLVDTAVPVLASCLRPFSRSIVATFVDIVVLPSRNLLTYLLHGTESFMRSQPVSASQEIPGILWNPKTHYRFHKCPPPVPTLSQINPSHMSPSHFLKIHLNIILQSMTGPSNWSLSLRFPQQNIVYNSPLPHTCYMTRQSH